MRTRTSTRTRWYIGYIPARYTVYLARLGRRRTHESSLSKKGRTRAELVLQGDDDEGEGEGESKGIRVPEWDGTRCLMRGRRQGVFAQGFVRGRIRR